MNIFEAELFVAYLDGQTLEDRGDLLVKIGDFREEVAYLPDGRQIKQAILVLEEPPTTRLVLNKTTARALAKLFGPETDKWRDKRVVAFTERKQVFGVERPVIKIRGLEPNEEGNRGK